MDTIATSLSNADNFRHGLKRIPIRWNRPLAQLEQDAFSESFALEESARAALQTNLDRAVQRAQVAKEVFATHRQKLDFSQRRVQSLKAVHDVMGKIKLFISTIDEDETLANDAHSPGISTLLGMVAQLGTMVDSTMTTASETTDHYSTLCRDVDHEFGIAASSLRIWDGTIARYTNQIKSSNLRLLAIKRHNAPSTRLPDEVFRSIFRYAVAFYRTDERSRSVFLAERKFRTKYTEITLSSVCHRWRSIVQDDPTLWSHICVPHRFTPGRKSLVEHYLILSRRIPLHLYIFIPNAPGMVPSDLQLLTAERAIDSISILTKYTDIYALLHSLPSPCILRLLHSRSESAGLPTRVRIPMNMVQKLEEIHLFDCEVAWTAPAPCLRCYFVANSVSYLADHKMMPPDLVPALEIFSIFGANSPLMPGSEPLVYPSVEEFRCSSTRFMSSHRHRFRFPSLEDLVIVCDGAGSLEDWKGALRDMVKFPTSVSCQSPEQYPLLLIQCVSLIKGLESLRLRGDMTTDNGLDIIADGAYKTDAETTASTVFKDLKTLIIDDYYGDGQSIARFVAAFTPPKVVLRGCHDVAPDVRAIIAQYTSLVSERFAS